MTSLNGMAPEKLVACLSCHESRTDEFILVTNSEEGWILYALHMLHTFAHILE